MVISRAGFFNPDTSCGNRKVLSTVITYCIIADNYLKVLILSSKQKEYKINSRVYYILS